MEGGSVGQYYEKKEHRSRAMVSPEYLFCWYVLSGLLSSKHTCNVWTGHWSTTDGIGSRWAADPSRRDRDSGAKDVHAVAEVGEWSASVIDIRGPDGYGLK